MIRKPFIRGNICQLALNKNSKWQNGELHFQKIEKAKASAPRHMWQSEKVAATAASAAEANKRAN